MWLPVSPNKRWGEAGSILEILGYNMWLLVSAVKYWGKAGRISEVLDTTCGSQCLQSSVELKGVAFQRP